MPRYVISFWREGHGARHALRCLAALLCGGLYHGVLNAIRPCYSPRKKVLQDVEMAVALCVLLASNHVVHAIQLAHTFEMFPFIAEPSLSPASVWPMLFLTCSSLERSSALSVPCPCYIVQVRRIRDLQRCRPSCALKRSLRLVL